MKAEKDNIIFNSGREVYAYAEIIGIHPDLSITYGYDGFLSENDLTTL